MIHQEIILDKYDYWHIDVYYGVSHYDVDDIMMRLHQIGCDGRFAKQAYNNLSSSDLNNGLTYSNYDRRKSVMVVGIADSEKQFINTLTHEQMHLATHIGKTYGMDMYGEEVCYLVGKIAEKMFAISSKFLCKCCRNKKTKYYGKEEY